MFLITAFYFGWLALVPAEPITVTGCLERDAASRTTSYNLVVERPNLRIYRLIVAPNVDLAPALGKSVEVTGDVQDSRGAPGAHREQELKVDRWRVAADHCS